jgi:hypothetical protein
MLCGDIIDNNLPKPRSLFFVYIIILNPNNKSFNIVLLLDYLHRSIY